MPKILLRLMMSCIVFFSVLIALFSIIGQFVPSDVFIYQEGFGHASVSYVLDLDSSYNARISNTLYASYPAYSPDGEQLAYFSYGEDKLALYLANRNTANNQLLLDSVTISNVLSWSPDSAHVAILLEDRSLGSLGVIDIASGQTQTVRVSDGAIRNVMWFSDTELFIMTSFENSDRQRNYYHYDLASDTLTHMTDLSPYNDVALSPDRNQVIGTDRLGNLWLWQRLTDDSRILTTHGAIIGNPTWSADGEQVAYTVALGNGQHGLYTYSLAEGQESEVLRGIGRIFSILFLPDNRLIFIRGGVTERAINIINSDGSGLRVLVNHVEDISNHLIWRPQ